MTALATSASRGPSIKLLWRYLGGEVGGHVELRRHSRIHGEVQTSNSKRYRVKGCFEVGEDEWSCNAG
jgi:hypothetical protein